MKEIILGLAFVFSSQVFASTYDCSIKKETLGPDYIEDLEFQVIVNGELSTITMYEEAISDRCELQEASVTCKDDEGMPYIAKIKDENTVSISVGYLLPETDATCKKN